MTMPNSTRDDTPSRSDWAALVDLQAEQAAEIRVIKTGYTHLTQQLAEVTVTLHAQDRRIAENATQLASIAASVDANTKMTSEALQMLGDVRDAVTAATVLSRVAKWAAGALITGSALWLAVKDIFGVKTP
jgi:hypothetical protein